MKIDVQTLVMLTVMIFGMGGSWMSIDSRLSGLEKDVAKLDVTERIHRIDLWIAGWEAKWPALAEDLRLRRLSGSAAGAYVSRAADE